tara:strand:+ start:1350 stop:2711 length:1362 start_codon:yes stop_codon:yes gene_type:complete
MKDREAVYLDLIFKSDKSDKIHEYADKIEEVDEKLEEIKDMKTAWVSNLPILDDYDVAMSLSKEFSMNITQAKQHLETFPRQYAIGGKTIPDTVRELKKYRRKLKGDEKIEFTKSIDNLVVEYGNHLSSCIKSIYWLSPYETPLRQMRYKESDLRKLYSVKDEKTRRSVVESLCKFWEADLHRGNNYNSEYCSLTKQMTNAKRSFSKTLKGISSSSIKKSISTNLEDTILKMVCENQGIGSRQIHERLPLKLHNRTTQKIIYKVCEKLKLTNIEGGYYKLPMEIKKDLHAYTAAFIDSDGYITMDRNFNPRVGIIATGKRGRAFVTELHKELDCGRLHLDQKSPQDTRLINRLNFYSQDDIVKLLTKCRPYFRMKGENADILTELIRIKKSHKKESWAKERMSELFKLMKYANHSDNTRYDFASEGIYMDDIAKYKDNCKMGIMNSLESGVEV